MLKCGLIGIGKDRSNVDKPNAPSHTLTTLVWCTSKYDSIRRHRYEAVILLSTCSGSVGMDECLQRP